MPPCCSVVCGIQFLGVVGLRVLVPTWLLITTGFLQQQKFAPWKHVSQEAHQVGQQDRSHGVLQPSHWHGNQYVFYSLVAGHYLQGPSHIQGEGTVQRYKCMEGRVAGGHFRKLLAIISISIYCKYMAVHEHLPITDGNTNRIKKVDAWLYWGMIVLYILIFIQVILHILTTYSTCLCYYKLFISTV